MDVEVVAISFLFVLVIGNLDLLATKLSLVSKLDAVVSVLLLRKLDEAEAARLAIRLLELEGLYRAILGEMFPKLLLREIGGQVAHDDVGLFIEALLDYAHVDSGAMDLCVIHFLLAFLGFLNGREAKEAEPVFAFGLRIILALDLGIENFVATAFEKLKEVKIVKVLGQVTHVHRGQLVFLLNGGCTSMALLILSRWLVVVLCELQHVLKEAHQSRVIVVALRHLLHLVHLPLRHMHTLRLLHKVLSLGRILLHVG